LLTHRKASAQTTRTTNPECARLLYTITVEYNGNTLERFDNTRLIIIVLPAFQIIAFAEMFKGPYVVSSIFEGFSQCEMDRQRLVDGQVIPSGQRFKRGQIGITMMALISVRLK
jgi:hypothetical protein